MNPIDQLTEFLGRLGSVVTGLAPSNLGGIFAQTAAVGGLPTNAGVPPSNFNISVPSIDLPLPPAPKIPEITVPNLSAAGYASNVPQINFSSPYIFQPPSTPQIPNISPISSAPPADLYAGLNSDNIELS